MVNEFPAITILYFDVFFAFLKLPVAGRKPRSITASYLSNSSFSVGSRRTGWWARGPPPSSGCLIKWAEWEVIPRVMRNVKPSWCFIHENRCWLATGICWNRSTCELLRLHCCVETRASVDAEARTKLLFHHRQPLTPQQRCKFSLRWMMLPGTFL